MSEDGEMLIFKYKKWPFYRVLKIQITFIIAKSMPTCSAGHKVKKMYSLPSIRALVSELLNKMYKGHTTF